MKNFGRFLFDRVSFWDKIGCFVTRLCALAHSYSSTHFLNLQWHQIYCRKDPTFTYRALLLSYAWCSWTYLSVHILCSTLLYLLFSFILLFHFFCSEFYFPIVDIIVNHLYLLLLRSLKTNTKCCDKNEKNPQWYHLV